MKRLAKFVTAAAALCLLLTACGPSDAGDGLSGVVRIDGSSTVYPITEAAAEEFMKANRGVRVYVGVSGTTGGFKKWMKQEIDINNASRKIKDLEIAAAEEGGFGYVEVPIAYDGLAVVVNLENDWVSCMTREQLNMIWGKDSTVRRWSDVDPNWPDVELKLYGPGTDSGTFEYFTEYANQKARESRADYTASEDDHLLVEGVAGNRNSLGYFGFAHYIENANKMKPIAIDHDGDGNCVEPTLQSIRDLEYPISRHVYMYPTATALERPEVKGFLTFYLEHAVELVTEVGFVPLQDQEYEEILNRIR